MDVFFQICKYNSSETHQKGCFRMSDDDLFLCFLESCYLDGLLGEEGLGGAVGDDDFRFAWPEADLKGLV